MKLHEIKASDIKADESESLITQFFEASNVDEKFYKIRDDGKVDIINGREYIDVDSDAMLAGARFPFKWGNCGDCRLNFSHLDLDTFEGGWVPEKAKGLILSDNSLKNFNGLDGTQDIEEYELSGNEFTSFHNIHKVIPKAKRISIGRNPLKKDLLGIIMIEGLVELNDSMKSEFEKVRSRMEKRVHDGYSMFVDNDTGEVFDDFSMALFVVGQYIGEGRTGVLKAQEELEDLDLDDFANL